MLQAAAGIAHEGHANPGHAQAWVVLILFELEPGLERWVSSNPLKARFTNYFFALFPTKWPCQLPLLHIPTTSKPFLKLN